MDPNNCHQHDQCQCTATSTTAAQSLDELEFTRGIWSAALYNDFKQLQKCIDLGDVNRPDNYGYTALHYAARKNNFEICEQLLRNGANINAITKYGGTTPLHRAAMMGHERVVKLLLNNRANCLLVDDDGNTVLHRATQNNHINICKILVNHNDTLKLIKNRKEQIAYDLIGGDDTDSQELRTILSVGEII